MKIHHSLRFIKIITQRLLILFLIFQYSQSFASITIEMENNRIKVSTDKAGTAGYKGCETEKLKQVNAYVYTLYRKEIKAKNNTQTCTSSSTGRWVQVAKKESHLSEEEFPNMPIGEYKATVYSGQSIGCVIDGDTQNYPSKSIVYHQEKSSIYKLNNEEARLVDAEIISISINNSDNDAMKIFPNPTNGELHIQIQDSHLKSNATIIFYDLLGREAMTMSQSFGWK